MSNANLPTYKRKYPSGQMEGKLRGDQKYLLRQKRIKGKVRYGMKYQPITCVWEITERDFCPNNYDKTLRKEPQDDELVTEEALDICDQIADLGVRGVTLSGGDPLTRMDLPKLISKFASRGVAVEIRTSGWMMSSEMVSTIKESGVASVMISLDGTEPLHDSIYRPGSFARARHAYESLSSQNVKTGAFTTITRKNIDHLSEIKDNLVSMGVKDWQVQIGLPVENREKKPDWVIEASEIETVINFCHETAAAKKINIYLVDCLGGIRNTLESKELFVEDQREPRWGECSAGVRSFGILSNGDVLGCILMRDNQYIEGNIREQPLREIWGTENNFCWARQITDAGLAGHCGSCQYMNTFLAIN